MILSHRPEAGGGVAFIFSQETKRFPNRSVSKESTCNTGDLVQFLGQEDPLEKGYTTRSNVLGLLLTQLVKNLPAMRDTWV